MVRELDYAYVKVCSMTHTLLFLRVVLVTLNGMFLLLEFLTFEKCAGFVPILFAVLECPLFERD